MHCFVWVASNWQLMDGVNNKAALMVSIALAIPISLLGFYGTKIAYVALESAWAVRLLAFGISYLTFPIMTWVFLRESPFAIKTLVCIGLSITIVFIQVFLPNN